MVYFIFLSRSTPRRLTKQQVGLLELKLSWALVPAADCRANVCVKKNFKKRLTFIPSYLIYVESVPKKKERG